MSEISNELSIKNLFTEYNSKGLLTRGEGHPSKRVNPSWKAKDSPGLQIKFYR